ncbi:TSUP family transporter [Candidatus Pelagibacter communis]|jgi:uncharacterized protein|uniref:TSUP family transporter n=1 Tax=Pelagibacter ubique TaxID=198252 RepID=UPI000375B62D|nr:TSUP family transporter [Candidatus Pelagibacter ubique]
MDYFQILFILIIFSFIQSIFGVGLLLFGTPSLLLIGYEYHEILNILLPASITISFLQVIKSKENINKSKKVFIYYCLPILVLFTFIVLINKNLINFKLIISIFLIFSSLCALNQSKIKNLKNIILKNNKLMLIIIGFIHGVSNMGGSFLSIFSTITNENKRASRKNIAYCYLIMGLFQYMILLSIYFYELRFNYLYFFIISIFIFYISENIFIKISEKKFAKLVSIISLIYGVYIFQNILMN